MSSDEASTMMWKRIKEAGHARGRQVRLRVRFSGDVDGSAISSVVMNDDGPRLELGESARSLLSAVDEQFVATNIENEDDRNSWLSMFRSVRGDARLLTLNEACRAVFGPIFRRERTTHNYNAYVELRVDPSDVAEWFPDSKFSMEQWPSLADLRAAWDDANSAEKTEATRLREQEAERLRDELRMLPCTLAAHRKRIALSVLAADKLRDFVRDFDIQVDDYRSKDLMIAALSDGRRVYFVDILSQLTRDELKAMCGLLRLSDVGRDKRVLIQRVLVDGTGDEQSEEAEDETAVEEEPAEAVPARPNASIAITAAKKRIALDQLKADRLRGLVQKLEIQVENMLHREALIVGLSDGRRTDFARVLGELARDELKAMCTALGLDDTGREKTALILRILSGQESETAEDDYDDVVEARSGSALEALMRLASPVLRIDAPQKGWPAVGTVDLTTSKLPVSVYVRGVGRSGRSRPMERRFQNPADKNSRAIREPTEGQALLLGVWTEQGDERSVVVAMDAYRRIGVDTRVSMFMPLGLLEEAADTGYAEHRSHSGETIYAFRPAGLAQYVERMLLNAGLKQAPTPTPPAAPRATVTIAPATPAEIVADGHVQIRPKVGMYAAFARLNYKPWFAIAEFLDNAIQSHLSVLSQNTKEPLLIDVRIDDDEIVITDRAGGIASKDFPRAFSPSQPPPDPMGLSEFGLGMKAAACWFARTWSVRTSALGEPVERTIEFDIPKITREGIEALPISERATGADDHFTVVTLTNLLVRPRGRTLGKVKDHLSGIYRVLMRKGIVRIRLSTGSASEELDYKPPKLLNAPHFREPNGPTKEWKREFDFTLGAGKRVRGWAGLLETGSVSRAGFSVFRRDRLIQGSADETYRPSDIFRSPNSYTYQRLVGEIFVDGFDVSHTKDGIQWDGLEDAMIAQLKLELTTQDMPLLAQAEGYRAKRRAQDLEPGFGLAAVTSAGAVLSSTSTAEVLANQLSKVGEEELAEPAAPTAPEKTLTKRTFTVNVPSGQQPWCVTIELVSDPAAEWFQRGSSTKIEERSLHVLVNLAHPFSEQFINDAEATLAPLLRIVCGLSLAEETARESGVRHAGEIRRRLNQLLRNSLGRLEREDD